MPGGCSYKGRGRGRTAPSIAAPLPAVATVATVPTSVAPPIVVVVVPPIVVVPAVVLVVSCHGVPTSPSPSSAAADGNSRIGPHTTYMQGTWAKAVQAHAWDGVRSPVACGSCSPRPWKQPSGAATRADSPRRGGGRGLPTTGPKQAVAPTRPPLLSSTTVPKDAALTYKHHAAPSLCAGPFKERLCRCTSSSVLLYNTFTHS